MPAEAAEASLKISATGELHVQVKFKGAGFWSAKDFAAVVEDKAAKGTKGPKARARAKALLLGDANRRYVFITNTSVDAVLAKGRVKSPGDRSNATFIPTNLKGSAKEKQSLAGRFALIEGMTLQEARRQIDEILTAHLHVPIQSLDPVVDRLKRMVEDRFLEVPDPLRRRDVEKVAEEYGGIPHPNPQLARYVPPANLADAENSLTKLGAVLLIGPSGYGKSLTADKLTYDRRQADPPYQVVREMAGLAAIEAAFAAPGRVLFHLEDPWGQSGLKRSEAEDWSKRIAALIQQRAPDKQFVITSRSEIYRAALGAVPAPTWSDRAVVIDDAAYDNDARRAVLHGGLATAVSWRQDLVHQHEPRLLRELKSPFELIAFGRELTAISKPDEADVNRLVDRALSDSRLQVVRDQIGAFGDRGVRGAAVLWSLLRYSQNLQPGALARLRREVDRAAKDDDIALDDLALHLAQTQLTKDGDGAYTAHAKVIEAVESLAREYPRAAETGLNAATRAAVALAEREPDWLDALQRLVAGARELEGSGVLLDEDIVIAFEGFLIDGLSNAVGNSGAFRKAWRAASRQLTTTTPIGRLVDWLERGAPKESGWAGFGWQPPKITKVMRDAIVAADPGLRILRGFIAHQLPWTSTDYDADKFLSWLKPFGVDFTDAFLTAGRHVVGAADFVMSADAISEGAMTGRNPPHDIVWDQILEMDAAVDAALTASREERRQAWQGELDFAAGLAIQERVEDEGPSAAHFAKGYVKARRRQEGHSWIQNHPRPDLILPLWAETMRHSSPKVTPAELDAFFSMAGDDDRLQAEGLGVIADRRLSFARGRVLAALSSGGPKAVDAAVRALSFLEGDGADNSGKSSAQAILLALLPTLTPTRAALLASEITDLEFGKKKAALAQRVLAASPPDGAAAVHLALARTLGADDATLLQRFRELPPGQADTLMAQGPRGLARLLLVISAAEGHDVFALAEEWAVSDDEDDAQAAIQALASLNTAQGRTAIIKALHHSHYEVRRSALQALS
ncbi:HEAT repeat domain-containing protein, partial [Devosia pacifica]|uniref:HEAT repeat domain-containing protein n=1 Tax=Devosia pacifica TaxID=1335967 RepID=UPI001677D071